MNPKISIITPAKVRAQEEFDWLGEAIASVADQSYQDWEMIIVDDGSPVAIRPLQDSIEDERVKWFHTEGVGAATARNLAADRAMGELLLPLDADDKLAPEALQRFWEAWKGGGEQQGIVYSDVMIFGEDFSKVYAAPEYDFGTLLRNTFMSIGCLHRKGAWNRIGGWRMDMEGGLEDWEYWVHMGEQGVCGYHVAEPLYWYRQNPRGRLRHLKEDQAKFNAQYQKMREIHRDTYDGRWPVGCCGGRRAEAKQNRAPVAMADMVEIRYAGPRQGSFVVLGQESRTRYRVPGAGKTFMVDPRDVAFFRSFRHGREYQAIVSSPAQGLQIHEPATASPVSVRPQPVSEPIPDPGDMSVSEIKAMQLNPLRALQMLTKEQAGKARVTAIAHLKTIAQGEET